MDTQNREDCLRDGLLELKEMPAQRGTGGPYGKQQALSVEAGWGAEFTTMAARLEQEL